MRNHALIAVASVTELAAPEIAHEALESCMDLVLNKRSLMRRDDSDVYSLATYLARRGDFQAALRVAESTDTEAERGLLLAIVLALNSLHRDPELRDSIPELQLSRFEEVFEFVPPDGLHAFIQSCTSCDGLTWSGWVGR